MEITKLLLILNLGILHPASTGTFEAYSFSEPKWEIINPGNDHAWLFASRLSVLGGAASAFFWSKEDPSFREMLLTSVGTAFMADAVRNVFFRSVQTGQPFYRDKFPDLRLGFFEFKGVELDGKWRLAEFGVGLALVIWSELW